MLFTRTTKSRSAWLISVLAFISMGCGGCDITHQGGSNTGTGNDPIATQDATLPVVTSQKMITGGFDEEYLRERQRIESAVDDPLSEGWRTEALQSAAKDQLKELAKHVSSDGQVKTKDLGKLVTGDFSCGPLRPKIDTAYADEVVRIGRAKTTETDAAEFTGIDGLATALADLTASIENVSQLHFAFKVFGIDEVGKGQFTTVQYVTVTGSARENGFEQNAKWRIQWRESAGKEPPRIQRIQLEQYEEAELQAGGKSLFRECTEAVLSKEEMSRDALGRGVGYWVQRVDRLLGPDFFGHQGLAIGDVNGDGLDDVYVCQSGGLPNRLFVQNPDGTASDKARQAGVDFNDVSSSALLVDLDNDGDQDLVLCTRSGPATIFLENDGQGKFTVKTILREGDHLSATAADYDEDGDLDIYLCGYRPQTDDVETYPMPMPFHDANNGGRNAMLRNDGNWQFPDVTEEVGLDVDNRRYTFAASWEDYDNDGDLDVYVANDFGRNNLYRNDGGKFINAAPETNTEDFNFGMSASWGDYNRDGWMDLYISNMFSGAGNRIVTKSLFRPGVTDDVRASFLRMSRGNTLFENTGDGKFRETSVEAGVTLGRWAWGSNFVDINNDGWEDLIVANGHITSSDTRDL